MFLSIEIVVLELPYDPGVHCGHEIFGLKIVEVPVQVDGLDDLASMSKGSVPTLKGHVVVTNSSRGPEDENR